MNVKTKLIIMIKMNNKTVHSNKNLGFCNYNFKINQTIIVTPINSNCIRCYSKLDMNEEKLLFEYNWSRLEKIKRKL